MVPRPRILIIDDDVDGLQMLDQYLRARYEVRTCPRPGDGVALARSFRPRLVLLDVDMPGMNGFETCQAIRAIEGGADIQVIFMSADGQAASMQKALSLGANDYVVKPLRLQDLLDRIDLRLMQSHSDEPMLCANLLLEPASLTATIGDERVQLTEKAFRVLQLLLRNEGRIVTRQQLLDHAWGGAEVSDRAVDVQLSRLRKVLKNWDGTVEMIYGQGYIARVRYR